MAAPLKPQTEPMANREAHGHTMSYLPSLPPHVVAQRVPEYVVAQRAPGCNRSSRGRAVIESHRAFGFLGKAAVGVEAATFSRLQNAVRSSTMLLQRLQPNPKIENLNSGEPANPHPQSQTLNCGRSRWASGACTAQLWKAPSTLPLATRRQSQECCPGSIYKRTAATEDGGAAGPLCEVYIHVSTATETSKGTWETARAQTRSAEFRGFMHKTPKALHGRAATP